MTQSNPQLRSREAVYTAIQSVRSTQPKVTFTSIHKLADFLQVSSAKATEAYSSERLIQSLLIAVEAERLKNDATTARTQLVKEVFAEVETLLAEKTQYATHVTISNSEVTSLVEKVLAKRNEFGVAELYLQAQKQDDAASPQNNIRIIKRDGKVIPWSLLRIEAAIRKSFYAQKQEASPAAAVAESVQTRVLQLNAELIQIETIQDLVQEELMKANYFKVAAGYVLYREARRLERLATAKTTHSFPTLKVTLADGSTQDWTGADLQARVTYALTNLNPNLDAFEIETELRRSLFDGIAKKDIRKTVTMNAKSLIERDSDFALIAGRVILSYIYEEVLNWDILKDGIPALRQAHIDAFESLLQTGVKLDRVNSALLSKFDLKKIAAALDPSADLEFDHLGVEAVYDRYLLIDKSSHTHKRIETPQTFWMRVAMGLALNEKDPTASAIETYQMVKSRRYCHSTPTLFNSGTPHSQLSSCYLYHVEDSQDGIMGRGLYDCSNLAKWAGGLGGSWTSVRGTGSHIKGTNGESTGVIPFLKMHNDMLVAWNQGGKRKGAGCTYIETWHNDILEFLELRKNVGDDRRRTHDMNTANWIPDLFMKRMEERKHWTLFRSNEVKDLHDLFGKKFEEAYLKYEALAEEGKIYGLKIEALELWKKMLSMLFETGHPWITFKDPCNVRSPQDHAGVIHCSNLCTEITLNTSRDEIAVCNLASVIIENHLTADGQIDHKKLRETVRVAVRNLDNVIDLNFYPVEAAKVANMRHRPVGLGMMGLQNALYIKNLAFDSEEAKAFGDEVTEAIAYYAYEASSDLSAERGHYSTYPGSKWDRGILPQDTVELLQAERGLPIRTPRGGKLDWTPLRAKISKQGMRNSNVMAIAPTATISNITRTTPCIEPAYKNLFVKSNMGGDFVVINEYLIKALKARNLWNNELLTKLKISDGEVQSIPEIPADIKALFKTAFEIDPKDVIDAASRRGKWIDQSQSVNLWLAKADLKALSHMYREAWHAGLKTTYYLRTMGASSIEKSTVAEKKQMRGVTGEATAAVKETTSVATPEKKTYTAEEKKACSIEAMKNGEECESCQ